MKKLDLFSLICYFSSTFLCSYWALWRIDSGDFVIGATPILGLILGFVALGNKEMLDAVIMRRFSIFCVSTGLIASFILWSIIADRPHPIHLGYLSGVIILTSLMMRFYPGKIETSDSNISQLLADGNISISSIIFLGLLFEGHYISIAAISFVCGAIYWFFVNFILEMPAPIYQYRISFILIFASLGLYLTRLSIEYHLPWNPPKFQLHPGSMRVYMPLLFWCISGAFTSAYLGFSAKESTE